MKNEYLVIKLYQNLYEPTIVLANLNDLAGHLSQVVRPFRPSTGKFWRSLIKGYAGFTTNRESLVIQYPDRNHTPSTERPPQI